MTKILGLNFRDAYLAKTFGYLKSDSVQVECRPIKKQNALPKAMISNF